MAQKPCEGGDRVLTETILLESLYSPQERTLMNCRSISAKNY